MKIKLKYFFILSSLILSCKKDISKNTYIIDGEINNYNEKIYLINYNNSKYYLNNFVKDSSLVINGKFQFKLPKNIKYPLQFYVSSKKGLITKNFILEPKDQKIVIDSFYFHVKPRIISKNSTIRSEENEYNNRTSASLEVFRQSTKEILSSNIPKNSYKKLFDIERQRLTHSGDSILVGFAKEYPDSFFSFWRIVNSQLGHGYSKEIEMAYNNLSTKIKRTEIAKLFEEDIKNAKLLHTGNYFPEISLKNRKLESINFKANKMSSADYVLIDFWFIHCSPCIAQFPRLKKLYSKYGKMKLEIINISTDKTSNIDDWNKTIDKHGIKWINLLDENGIESIKLSINKFPTNYLLNKEGKILKKDISLDELEELIIMHDKKK